MNRIPLTDATIATASYLRYHPGTTCRDVAIDVMGGTGRTRTGSRARAYNALIELERMGRARRVKPTEYSKGSGDRWWHVPRESHPCDCGMDGCVT